MTFREDSRFGFDISFWQDVDTTPLGVDFHKMRSYGASFVIIRIGQGEYIDSDFLTNWKHAKGVLPRACYWFYDPRVNPTIQAQTLITNLRDDPPEARVWLDLEFNWPGNYAASFNWKTFLDRVKNAGFRVGVYTSASWWQVNAVERGADLQYFGGFPSWVAQYNNTLTLLPKGLPEPLIWQKGTPAIGRAAGVESEEIDLDIWNANKDFTAEWGALPELPDEGESMSRYEAQANSSSSRALRPNHDTLTQPYEYVGANKRMHGDELWIAPAEVKDGAGKLVTMYGDKWLRVLDVEGDTTRTGWVAIIHLGQVLCTLRELNPEPPPPVPSVHLTHSIRIYSDGSYAIDDGPIIA